MSVIYSIYKINQDNDIVFYPLIMYAHIGDDIVVKNTQKTQEECIYMYLNNFVYMERINVLNFIITYLHNYLPSNIVYLVCDYLTINMIDIDIKKIRSHIDNSLSQSCEDLCGFCNIQ